MFFSLRMCEIGMVCNVKKQSVWTYGFYPNVTTLCSGLCYCKSVRLSSVTFVRPSQRVEAFGNISSPLCTLASFDLRAKFYGDRPRKTVIGGVKRKRGSKIERCQVQVSHLLMSFLLCLYY